MHFTGEIHGNQWNLQGMVKKVEVVAPTVGSLHTKKQAELQLCCCGHHLDFFDHTLWSPAENRADKG